MSDDIRLDLLRDAICRSDLDGQTKDALADDLKYAQDINGTEDEALRGIKRLLISGVRRELLAHERMAASFDGGTRGVMFLASASAPAPVEPVFPKGWSNEVELVKASVKKVYSVTNFYGAWGDDAARSAARAARDEMVRYWVEVFRTNGIPEEFMERRRGVRPAVKDPDVIEVKENITPALKAR
jgi:hypothetical protein